MLLVFQISILRHGMMTRSSGTLTIGTRGETSFMSSTARSEVYLTIYCKVSDYDHISYTLSVSRRGNSELCIFLLYLTNALTI